MAKTHVSLFDGFRTNIRTRNHFYHADEPIDAGGTDDAVTPSEMVMGALGSCIAMTIKMYSERKGWPLEGVEVSLDFERFRGIDYEGYNGNERYVHEIRKAIILHGDLTPEQRERALEIGSRCPVHRLMSTPAFWVEKELKLETATLGE